MYSALNASKLTMVMMAIISTSVGTAAFAQNSGDYFGRSTGPSTPTTTARIPSSGFNAKRPEVAWFEYLDMAVATHSPRPDEKTQLTSGFGSPPQLERVIAWQNTAADVAKRYRDLAKTLVVMSVPSQVKQDPQAAEIDKYKHLLSDWYNDSAAWLEDYIKPRQPATTKEELQDQLRQMHERSETLKLTMTHLQEMDSKLRDHFGVHPPKQDNAIGRYASENPAAHK